jgi:hypothetical protein
LDEFLFRTHASDAGYVIMMRRRLSKGIKGTLTEFCEFGQRPFNSLREFGNRVSDPETYFAVNEVGPAESVAPPDEADAVTYTFPSVAAL